ncbi:uncharacterized protein [Engystomops pustulosus]|uniref:uncharacterized protein isoform X2 n=1 Tax=Engystomops pustulosus TaxID=76066 RepID=UPI003AFAB16D
MEWWFIYAFHIILFSQCASIPRCQHYLSRRKEGVFHYDRHMRYQLSYQNAQKTCIQDFGGKIATREQLEKAFKSGLEECRAGWILSAEVAYPRINKHWNCGENRTGIISYGVRQNLQEKWDVFCYKENDDCSHYERTFFKVPWKTTEVSPRSIFFTTSPVKHETKILIEQDGQNNINNSTHVPASVLSLQTKPYLTINAGRSRKTTLNSTTSRLHTVANIFLHEFVSNIYSDEKVGKEKLDVLPQQTATENPGFYNKTYNMTNIFPTTESITTNMNLSIIDGGQNQTGLHNTDLKSQFKSHSYTLQTTADNILSQDQKHPLAISPVLPSFPPASSSDFTYNGVDIFSKSTVDTASNAFDFTTQHMRTKNQTDILYLMTDHIMSKSKPFIDTQPTTSSYLHYQNKEVQEFVNSEKNVSSESTPTSNLEKDNSIDRNFTRGTLGNQTFLPAKETISSPRTSTLSVKEPAIETRNHSKNFSQTKSSFFTLYDHMRVTASPTPYRNGRNVRIDSCGGWFKTLSGQFHSPGFPQSYEKDMKCIWVIEVPLGYHVVLEFVSLVLEEHRNCEYDYVMVYDGMESDQRVLGRFCGSLIPSQIHASSNVMTVIMRSDTSVELDGISVQFRATQTSSGIILTDGKNSLEGVVEIEYQGVRGNICAKQWTNNEAQVVCRQLGFLGPAIATRINGDDRVTWALSFVSCHTGATAFENCHVKNTGICGTTERAAVICQVYGSCAHLKNAGVQESGTYTIDPDGVGNGESHFPVECDMSSDITTGITIVGHDLEGKERAAPCQAPGCHSRVITYKAASLAQLRALTVISENCKQSVKLDCRHVRFLDGPWGWWVSRDGEQIISWGGADTNSGRCACGENGECAFGIPSCNCDANDDIWRMDEGAIMDKSSLPVQEFRFGGTSNVPMAMAFYHIGKLRCWGTISEPPVLESCAALKEAGITDSGRYTIDPDGVGKGVPQFEVFCDMSSNTGITVIGHNSERRMPVSPCEEAGCYKRELVYSANLLQLNALTKVSQSCEQFVRLDCRHLRFIQSGWGWWVSWDGRKMDYWGGSNPSIGGCACGRTGTCSSPEKLCNCDSNDNVWRTDDGFLRDKTTLPIQAVHFGDTNDFPLEMAYHTIGKLRCRGQGYSWQFIH